jgi:glycine/D-amino acid oxidase-like deaminating enzyme
MQVEFEREGKLNLASHPWQIDGLRSMQRNYARFGIECDWLEGDALTQRLNSPVYHAGLLEPNYALLNPAKMAAELRRACLVRGVQIFEQSPVRELRPEQDGLLLRTADGDVRAGKVALATKIAPTLLGHLASSVIPVYDYILVSEPLSEA